MDKKEIERLEEIVLEDFKCDNLECCKYGEYEQCYNHSHSICGIYEIYFQSKLDGGKK